MLLFKTGEEADMREVLYAKSFGQLYRIPFILSLNFRVILKGIENDL